MGYVIQKEDQKFPRVNTERKKVQEQNLNCSNQICSLSSLQHQTLQYKSFRTGISHLIFRFKCRTTYKRLFSHLTIYLLSLCFYCYIHLFIFICCRVSASKRNIIEHADVSALQNHRGIYSFESLFQPYPTVDGNIKEFIHKEILNKQIIH